MDERLDKLKTKWFGLKKSDVHREVRRLKRLQEAELDSLKTRRDEMQKEHARLTEQRGQLLRKRRELILNDGLRKLALDRLPDAVSILQQFAEEEKNALLEYRNQIDRLYEQKADRIEQTVRRYRELARGLLQELGSLIEQLRLEGWQDIEESAIYSTAVRSFQDNSAGLHSGADKKGFDEQETPETLKQRPERSETKAKLAQVIQFRAKSIVDRYASQLATADGLALSYDVTSSVLHRTPRSSYAASNEDREHPGSSSIETGPGGMKRFGTAEQAAAEEEHESSQTPSEISSPWVAAAPLLNASIPAKRSKFWGEAADFLQPAGTQTSAIFVETNSYKPGDDQVMALEENPPKTPVNEPEQLPQASGTPASPPLDGERLIARQPTETTDNASSPVIDEEIMKIRYRYIVGKTAGEDLNAPDGKRIISRGEVITSEVVALADRYGKLPELIVNMTIPGLGDA
jgi:hypothetical protein